MNRWGSSRTNSVDRRERPTYPPGGLERPGGGQRRVRAAGGAPPPPQRGGAIAAARGGKLTHCSGLQSFAIASRVVVYPARGWEQLQGFSPASNLSASQQGSRVSPGPVRVSRSRRSRG
jgi:hypothetical protein